MDTAFEIQSYSDYRSVWSDTVSGEASAEYVVPDSMPDIETIIDADGIVLIRSKDIVNGRLSVECEISVRLLYQAEERNRLFPLSVNIKCTLDSAVTADDNCLPRVKLQLRTLDTRIINSRKLSIRAELSGECCCYEKINSDFIYGAKDNEQNIECLQQNIDAYFVSDIREKTFVVTNELPMEDLSSNTAEILTHRLNITTTGSSFSGNKLIFKGCASVFLLIQREQDIIPYTHDFEFTQIVESDVEPDVIPEIVLTPTGIYFDMPERSGGKLGVELHLLAQILCRKKDKLNFLTDAYSNHNALEIAYENIELSTSFRDVFVRQTLTVNTEANGLSGNLLYSKCHLLNASISGNTIDLILSVKAIYHSSEGNYTSSAHRIQQALTVQIEEGENLSLEQCSINAVFCSLSGSALEFRIPIELQLRAFRLDSMQYICAIEKTEEKLSDTPSLTLLKYSEEESLWALAKRHHSTRQAILSANNGHTDGIILVPKCR